MISELHCRSLYCLWAGFLSVLSKLVIYLSILKTVIAILFFSVLSNPFNSISAVFVVTLIT